MTSTKALVSIFFVLSLAQLWVAAASARSPDNAGEPGRCSVRCGGGGISPERSELLARAQAFSPGEGSVYRIPTGSSYLDDCNPEFVPAGQTLTVRPDPASVNLTDVGWDTDHWVIFCGPSGLDAYVIYPDGDPPPAPIIGDMIADAYERTPVVAFNPLTSPPGDEDITLVTQMTTFLWVDQEAWVTPVSATAAIPGFSVTTTALPYIAHWSGGDEPTRCTGDDMHPYVFGIGGDEAQPSNCTMVYRQSSALRDHVVELAVDWDISYSCSIPVCGGPLPDLTTNSIRSVVVGEIQAVETRRP